MMFIVILIKGFRSSDFITIVKGISMRTHQEKTCLYNFDPLKPHFYIVKLGFAGVYIIFLISAQKHRLWVLTRRGGSNEYTQYMF